MSKEMWLITLGFLVIITPYLGVPGSWKSVIFVAAGAGVAIIGFILRGEALARGDDRADERDVAVRPSVSTHENPTLTSLN